MNGEAMMINGKQSAGELKRPSESQQRAERRAERRTDVTAESRMRSDRGGGGRGEERRR